MKVEPKSPADEDLRLSFTYDYMGRRVQKVVEKYESSAWTTNSVTKIVWDGPPSPRGIGFGAAGWLLVADPPSPSVASEDLRLDGLDSDALVRTYTWGLDLSGTFQGAGGIGGLLMVDDTTGDGFCGFYAYDGNGNVCQVIDAEDDSVAAHYPVIPPRPRETGLRDPHGREILATGAYADDNPWRFSTKYLDTVDPGDPDASLLYYGYRSYSPRLGRWMSRDPLQERESVPLYVFAENNGTTLIDVFGLMGCRPHPERKTSCQPTGGPETDVFGEWSYVGFLPVGKPAAPTGGFVVFDTLRLRWVRTRTREWKCCCDERLVFTKGFNGYHEDVSNYSGEGWQFESMPGAWKPIPTGASIFEYFIDLCGGFINFTSPLSNEDRQPLESAVRQHEPPPDEKGYTVLDPPTPDAGQLALYFVEPSGLPVSFKLEARQTIGSGVWVRLNVTLEGPDAGGRYRFLTSVPAAAREWRVGAEGPQRRCRRMALRPANGLSPGLPAPRIPETGQALSQGRSVQGVGVGAGLRALATDRGGPSNAHASSARSPMRPWCCDSRRGRTKFPRLRSADADRVLGGTGIMLPP